MKRSHIPVILLVIVLAVCLTIQSVAAVAWRPQNTDAQNRLYNAIDRAESALAPGNTYTPEYISTLNAAVKMAEMVYDNLAYANQNFSYRYSDPQVDTAATLLDLAKDGILQPHSEALIIIDANTELTGAKDGDLMYELCKLMPYARRTLIDKVDFLDEAALDLAFFYNIAGLSISGAGSHTEDDLMYLFTELNAATSFYYPPIEKPTPDPTIVDPTEEPTQAPTEIPTEKPSQTPADKTALQKKLNEAVQITMREYPDEESLAKLDAAIETAQTVMQNQYAAEAEVLAAVQQLTDAIGSTNLVDIAALSAMQFPYLQNASDSLETLTSLLNEARVRIFENVGGRGYDHDSLLRLYHALTRAAAVYNSHYLYSNKDFDAAYDDLTAALNSATEPTVDVNTLWDLIKLADYHTERADRYQAEDIRSLNLIVNRSLPIAYYAIYQEDIDRAADELNAAISALQPKYSDKHGDADLDGDVSIFDATHIQRALAKFFDPSEREQVAADIDDSGELDIYDVTCIQRLIAHLSINSPWYSAD